MKSGRIKNNKADSRSYADFLAISAVPAVMAWYYNGVQVFKLIFLSVLSAVACELVMSLLLKMKIELQDMNAVYIGVVMALMLPANASPWLAAAGCAFAIVVVKFPMGGTMNSPFVPAAAGFAFISLCKPELVFNYPAVESSAVSRSVSLASMLADGTSIRLNSINTINLLIGEFVGPMGATCTILLLCSLIYIAFRRPAALLNSFGFLLACVVMAILCPRVQTGILSSVLLEMSSGMLIFAAVFLVTDPGASPKRLSNRFIYGVITGVLCMLIRYYGKFEESVCFAVLMTNAIWPVFRIFFGDTPNGSRKVSTPPAPAEEVVKNG